MASLLFHYSYFRKNWVKERGNKSIFSYILTAAGTIDCFECNSWDDPRCHDPFNYTIHKEHMPPIVECEGCCVKMVQFIGTGKNIHYTLRLKLLTKYCFMKQKWQIQIGVAQCKSTATLLSTKAINTTRQHFQMRYITLFYLKWLKSYQLSKFKCVDLLS